MWPHKAGRRSLALVTPDRLAQPRSQLRKFVAELRRRRVPQTALWYVGGSVALVEAANNFLPALGVPAAALRLLTIAAIFGLPIALTLSWQFDVFSDVSLDAKSDRLLRSIPIIVVTALCVSGAALVWNRQHTASAREAAAPAPRADPAHVAVLPFVTAGGDAELEAFAFNLQMRLIDGLSAAAATGAPTSTRLRVVSRSSVEAFSKSPVPLDSIRRALNVGTVLDGTVERARGAVLVRVRLVDTETGDQLATSVAEKSARDRLGLLDAVSDSVMRIIRQQLGVVVRNRMRLLETSSADAFNSFAAAMKRLDDFTSASAQKDLASAGSVLNDTDSLLAQAERLDPQWIEPIVKRGELTQKRLMIESNEKNKRVYIAAGLRHAERALRLRPDDYRALELRGYLRWLQSNSDLGGNAEQRTRLMAAAERDLRRSLVSNPTPATCYRLLSELARSAGHLEQALDYGARAYNEDPYLEQVQVTVFRLFEYSFALERDADAVRWCSEGRSRFADPVFDDCRLSLAAWSRYSITLDSATLIATHEVSAYPAALRPRLEPRVAALFAAVLARNHMADSARVTLADARRRDTGGAGMLLAAAGVYVLLGSRDSALLMVRELVSAQPDMRAALEQSPETRMLRSEPEFRRLTQLTD